ncbi:MAG: diphthine--ammonia ligase [Candidatus Thermoplasmatota archaeon]|jgi:ABC transporter with metal-binding/Fe-S-binding domain ATP-binding protein|nr:diphthine--ammonia ligase [Candidatus Thermoplasmatota archaeon]MCL5790868.1 diphthine--ammonia ligase [Candidatus Thermoplasmatota archaeon]
MKAITLLSGGKDSFLATLFALDQGHDVLLSVSVDPHEYSEMFHVPNIGVVSGISSLLDIPNIHIEEDRFYEEVPVIARKYGAGMIISGAIASNFQKTRIERMCTLNNLISYTPLWLVDQPREVREVVNSGIRAVFCSVSAEGLGEEYLGQILDEDAINRLIMLNKKYKINISGEGGEYESLVTGWLHRNMHIKDTRKEWNGSSGYFIVDI